MNLCPICQVNPLKKKCSGQKPVTCGDECSTLRSRHKDNGGARREWLRRHGSDWAWAQFVGVSQ